MTLLGRLHLPLCGSDNRIFRYGARKTISQKLIVYPWRRFMRFAWAFSDHYCYAKHTLIDFARCIAENRQMIIIVKNTRDFSTTAVAVAALMSKRRREKNIRMASALPCVISIRMPVRQRCNPNEWKLCSCWALSCFRTAIHPFHANIFSGFRHINCA